MKEEEKKWSNKDSINAAVWVLAVLSRCFTVVMRNKFGKEALAFPCFFALLLMLGWAALSSDRLMWAWIVLWLLCFAARRVEQVKGEMKGARIHSQDDGVPMDGMKWVNNPQKAKMIVEPIILGVISFFLYKFYAIAHWKTYGLPFFFAAGCFSVPALEGFKQMIWKKRVQDILDARIEQEAVMRDYRNRYGE
jgi:hypothetical protein